MTVSQIDVAAGGPRFSRLVLGLMRLPEWNLDAQGLLRWTDACLEMGFTTIDLADIYGGYTCEARFGEALKARPALRERIQIVTKCGIRILSPNRPEHTIKGYDTSRRHVLASVDNALKALHTDRIDLLLIHRPDPLMDADDTAAAFEALRQAGKVLHFGVSNFLPRQFELLASRLSFPLVTNQVEFSIANMTALHDGTLDQCQERRICPMVWSPFGGGRMFWADTDQSIRLHQALTAVGKALGGAALEQVALAWILRHPAKIIPILGSGKLERLQALAAAESLALSREQWFTIWSAAQGREVP